MEKQYFEAPKFCPACNELTTIKGAYLMCTNDFCSGLGTGNLERWANVLDIDDLGPKLIEMLYEKGLVKEPADFYTLTVEQIIGLERMGERSASKVIKNLKAKMELTLPELIAGLNIPNFGERTAQSLLDAGFDDIVKIYNAQENDLIQVKGIEIKTACQIMKGIKAKGDVVKRLLEVGIKIKKPEEVKIDSNKLQGTSYCFTGAINAMKGDGKRFTREDMHDLVIKNGGKVETSVKKGLTYLVMADISSVSGKAQKAKEQGVKMMSESEFFGLIG